MNKNSKKYIKKHLNTPLWSTVQQYCNKNVIYFDVPGHKKTDRANIMSSFLRDTFKYDINSSKEVDNLAHPEGKIEEALKLLSDAYDCDDSYFLTNGTTQGIHTLIAASVYPKEKIMIPRNAHKSTINGIILAGAIPIFIKPSIDDFFSINHNISLDELKKTVEKHPDAKTLLVLNPTYFGVVCDLKEIVSFCKEKGITVLADEAHGAHFYFSNRMPLGALQAGAAGSAISVHKTLGSLTQSSALIWNKPENGKVGIQSKYIWQWNNILTTTSPNFLLMASVDAARSKFATEGKQLIDKTLRLSKYARQELSKIRGIRLLTKQNIKKIPGAYDLDETKLVIKVDALGYSGFEFYEELRTKYNIQIELAETKVVMAVLTFADTTETIDILINAIKEIAANQRKVKRTKKKIKFSEMSYEFKTIMPPREAIAHPAEEIDIVDSEGRISADSMMYYPPGIPLVLPGEVITKDIIEFYKQLAKAGVRILTSASESSKILVIRNIISKE